MTQTPAVASKIQKLVVLQYQHNRGNCTIKEKQKLSSHHFRRGCRKQKIEGGSSPLKKLTGVEAISCILVPFNETIAFIDIIVTTYLERIPKNE